LAEKQPVLGRVRNSSLVEYVCADNVPGLSGIPKLWISIVKVLVVGEHSLSRRRNIEKYSGGIGRENAGISNDMTGEIPVRRNPKGSWVKVLCPG
jgi:hypothetical protein